MSLNAQRQLNKSQLAQNTAMERLSSGLRINSAKDDAAGLAISTGMSSQVRGLNQAVRNANDGISMAQTAEGSMDEMTNILQRMRELSVQAANDTNSSSNRASIQIEIDQLYSEMDRIAETTSFNGINLLDGSNKSTNLHIGSESGQSLSFSIDAVTTKDLNLNAVSGTGELNGGRTNALGIDTAGDITINGSDLGTVAAGANSAELVKNAVNAITGASGVSAEAYNIVSGTAGQSGVTSGLTIDGGAGPVNIGATGSMQELVDTINRDVGGVTAKLDGEGALQLTNDTGKDIVVGGTVTGTGLTADTFTGYVALTSSDGEPIELGKGANGTDADLQQMGFVESTGSDNITGASVGANTTILATDKIQINGVDLGAVSGTTAADKAFAINAISDESGVTASATTQVSYEVNVSLSAADSEMTINGVAVDFKTLAVESLDDVVTAINGAGIQGVVASADEETGSLVLTSQAGSDVNVVGGSTAAFVGTNGSTTVAAGATETTTGKITLTGKDGADVIVSSTTGGEAAKDTALAKMGFTNVGGNSKAVGTGLSVNTVANANNTIDRIDDALGKISDGRANLGAIQNRLSSTISNLANVSQNISAANSRIRDADFAAETSALSKSQVLQQAGTAMLSQANASTQSVLSLLG